MDEDTYQEILDKLPELREDGCPEKKVIVENNHVDAHIYRAFRFCCGRFLRTIGDEGADGRYTDAELKLRLDLVAGKASWYGDYAKDLWCWTRNCNPVLALCFSHPLHPVSRYERAFITILQAVFVMMLSTITPHASYCIAYDQHACFAPKFEDGAEDAWVCCVCHKIGLTWFVQKVPGGLGGALYAVIVNIIFAQLLYQLGAGCSCTQDRAPQVRRFWELMGHFLMFAVFLAMVFPTAVWLDYNQRHGMLKATIVAFVINKPVSVLGTTAVQTLIFTYIWHKQQESDAARESCERYFVTAPDYRALVAARGKALA